MNTQEVRTARGNRRRKSVIDLNVEPHEHRDQEGSSATVRPPRVPHHSPQGESVPAPRVPHYNPQGESIHAPSAPTTIDVDAIEDDVVESSAIAFAEAKNKSMSTRRRPLMVDVESGGTTRLPADIRNKRRRVPTNQPVIDCELSTINVVEVETFSRVSRSKAPAPTPTLPEEPKFTCPICICPFTEEVSTKCGHIFCKECIKTAISRQAKCPTCRKRVTAKELIRVFLPATR